MMPKIRATTSSVPAFDQPLAAGRVMPDTAQVATPRAAAETSTRSRNLMVQTLRELLGHGSRGCAHRVAAEEAAVGVGGGAAPGTEVVAQRGRVAEAGPVGDRVHRLVALLQQLLSQQDALPDQPALRRSAGALHDAAGQGA